MSSRRRVRAYEVHIQPHRYGVFVRTLPSLQKRRRDFVIRKEDDFEFVDNDTLVLREIVRVAFEEGGSEVSVHVKTYEMIVRVRNATEQQRRDLIDAIAKAMRALSPQPEVTATYTTQ